MPGLDIDSHSNSISKVGSSVECWVGSWCWISGLVQVWMSESYSSLNVGTLARLGLRSSLGTVSLFFSWSRSCSNSNLRSRIRSRGQFLD